MRGKCRPTLNTVVFHQDTSAAVTSRSVSNTSVTIPSRQEKQEKQEKEKRNSPVAHGNAGADPRRTRGRTGRTGSGRREEGACISAMTWRAGWDEERVAFGSRDEDLLKGFHSRRMKTGRGKPSARSHGKVRNAGSGPNLANCDGKPPASTQRKLDRRHHAV